MVGFWENEILISVIQEKLMYRHFVSSYLFSCIRFSVNLWKQLLDDFVKKENITLEGALKAEVLLGRDTRPSGASLLEAAKQVRLHLRP